MPSVLIEVGFISNANEERYLKSKKGQDYMSSAIFRAFRSYKEEIERHSSRTFEVVEEPVEVLNDVYYCIQVKSSSKKIPLNAKVFSGLENVSEKHVNGIYKYSVEQSPNLKTVINKKKQIKKIITDCFIVAYYKGKPISIKEAKNIQKS